MTDSIENLHNLLLLGVVFVTGHPKLPCAGEKAPDGWNWPPSTWFRLTNLSVAMREIRSLYDTKTIRITCISTEIRQLLALKVYLIPEELRVKHQPRHQYSFAIQHMDDKRKTSLSRLIPYFYIPGKDTAIVPFYRASLGTVVKVPLSEERLNGWLTQLCGNKQNDNRGSSSDKSILMSLYESVDFVPQYDSSDPHVDAVFSGHVDNLKSELYPYQAETVAQMMHMEENPRTAVSARYLKIGDFYFHPEHLVARRDLPESTGLSRGGILAENMGLGKTCICLALICATRKSMATVPSQYSDTLSETVMKVDNDSNVDRLMVMVARKVAEVGAPWGLYTDRLSPSCIATLSSIRCSFLMPDIPRVRVSSRTAAAREQRPPRRIHLSAATLLVCPDSLPFQWLTETQKHTENLKVIHISSTDMVPTLDDALGADLIIITNSVLKEVFSKPQFSHIQDIRWRRLIVDEGHVVGNNNSILDICGQEWIAECRWVVSGTPTAGLTRLDTKTLFDHRSDLQKLGRIMGEFLKIEPWCSNPSSWQQSVVKPLLAGRYDGFEHAVRVLSGVLVRHHIKDVEKSTRLPPLHHKVVFVEPSFYDRIISNLYVSHISQLNAVDEKKFGVNNLLRRIRGVAVTSTNYDTRDLQYFLDSLSEYIHENHTALTTPEGKQGALLVQKMFAALNYAASSGNWLQIANTQEMPFFVEDRTRTVSPFIMPDSSAVGDKREFDIIGGAQLTYLQKAAGTDKDSKLNLWTETKSKDGTPLEGVTEELSIDPLFSKRYWTSYTKTAEHRRRQRDKKNDVKAVHHARQKVHPEDYLKQVGLPVIAAAKGEAQQHHPQLNDVAAHRPIIVGTGSAKLSYLVSKTLSLIDKHKIIVFYEDVDSGFNVAEAFEAAGIKHLIYTTESVSRERRAQYLATFEATDNFRVLLMNINAAAHGLNITSASWVFFLSPVWRRDIEAQAIKRAHRIGQKSEVHVETLVLKDTLEEEIYRRRMEISEADGETPKDMADDDQLRETILNYNLTSMKDMHKGTTDEIAFFDRPVPLYIDVDTHEQFESSLVHMEGLKVKKRRKKVVADGFKPNKKKVGINEEVTRVPNKTEQV